LELLSSPLHMRPRDFLKFAQLVADEGKWQGKQIVSKGWVTDMLAPHASIYGENDYGYTWWRSSLSYEDRELQVFSATGNGGQFLIIIPELELVVGINGGNYGDFRTWISWRDQLLPEHLFPAIKN
jgi:CubicO group peptidase (beta-lactamase class C family)